jgi:hypothetical protein
MRWLATFALLALLAAPASGADNVAGEADSAPRYIVLVIKHTQKGANYRTLEGLGIKRDTGSLGFGVYEETLQKAVGLTDIYAPLLAPTLCPGAPIQNMCPALRVIDDVKLPEAIAALRPSRIVLIGPHAGYSEKHQAFRAGWFTHVLDESGRRVNTFRIVFSDYQCDVACAQTAYPAAAHELAAMFRYMLATDVGYRTNALPSAWLEKSEPKDFVEWANACVVEEYFERVVRRYGLRLWVTPAIRHTRDVKRSELNHDLTLESLAWGGCNIVEGL